MERRSSKLPLRKEKVQSSCIWGLVDIFDFRNRRSNQKLLTTGRRPVQKEVSDFEHSKKVHTISSCCEKCQGFEVGARLMRRDADAFEDSIKNLMKQKFGNSKKSKKQMRASKKQLKNSDFELVNQLQDDQKRPRKTSRDSEQLHIQQWKEKFLPGSEQSSCSAEISMDKHKLEAMSEEIFSQIYQERICGDLQKIITPLKCNELDHVNVQLLQIAAKAFVDQIYINRKHNHKDGDSSKSKYFSDALEILNLNMDLFLKLLQNPNSLLLRSIQSLQFPPRDNESTNFYLDSKPSECGSGETRNPGDSIKIQKRNSSNPLWKKLKYQYGCSSRENTTSQASNKIVILKPGSTSKKNPENVSCHCSSRQAHKGLKNEEQIIKSTYFFKDIKRKFKQIVGENQQKQHWISMDESLRRLARQKHLLKDVDKGKSSDSVKGKSSFSPDAKRREKQQKLLDLATSNRIKTAPGDETLCENFSSSSGGCSKRQLDIFMEAKKHLSERLRNVDMGEIVPRKEAPRTLKMVLSSPEHDFLNTPSPKRDKSASISAQMRFSHNNTTQLIPANCLENEKGKEMDFASPLWHLQEVPPHDFRRFDEQLEISKKLQVDSEVMENIYSITDDLESSGPANILKANEVVSQKSLNLLEVPYRLKSTDDASSKQSSETTKKYEQNGYMENSNLNIPSENHPLRPLLSSSRSLNIHELEIVDTAKYKEEHASPVSVLEPFSPEDINSPKSIMSKPDESSLRPRRIDFDDYSQVVSRGDPKINTSAFMDMEEPLNVYVRAVVEASELSFNNEIYLKGPSPQDVLYTCIADIMGLYPVESYDELQLLFDCIHEVLLGIYESYFRYPSWLSFLTQKIRPVPLEKDVVDAVVKEVDLHLFPKMEQPTLVQLVAEDIANSGSWLDLYPDTEDILIQIAEDVLQDSIEDTILEVQI